MSLGLHIWNLKFSFLSSSRCLPSCLSLMSLNLSGNPSVSSLGLSSILTALREAHRSLTLLNLQGMFVCVAAGKVFSDKVRLLIHLLQTATWLPDCPLCVIKFSFLYMSVNYSKHKEKTLWDCSCIVNAIFSPCCFAHRLSGVWSLGQRRSRWFIRVDPGSASLLSGT